jgi:hypothetical protein
MRKVLSAILLVMLFTGCNQHHEKQPIESTESKETSIDSILSTEWMQKYRQYVLDHQYADNHNLWGLTLVDDDTIPEMILGCWSLPWGLRVLSLHQGEVSEWRSDRCLVYYIPRRGLINNCDGNMGTYFDAVVKLQDGTFNVIFYHEDVLIEGRDKLEDGTCGNIYECKYDGIVEQRFGDEMECHFHDQEKDSLYTPKSQSVELDSVAIYPISLLLE